MSAQKSGIPYPFQLSSKAVVPSSNGATVDLNLSLKNVRGRIPAIQASQLRSMILEAYNDQSKIVAHVCSYDGMSSRLVEEAGFPVVFLAGYAVASSYGLPDTGYIAMEDMCSKIQETVRMTSVPVMADGDTGYGSPMNVKRTVECYAAAGAAGIMIEDQTWPKRKFDFPGPKLSDYLLSSVGRMWSHKGKIRRFPWRSLCSYSSCRRRP